MDAVIGLSQEIAFSSSPKSSPIFQTIAKPLSSFIPKGAIKFDQVIAVEFHDSDNNRGDDLEHARLVIGEYFNHQRGLLQIFAQQR